MTNLSEPAATLYLTKNRSNSTCLNLECKLGFSATTITIELSLHTKPLLITGTCNSDNKDYSQITSAVTCAKLLYSASTVDLKTICFLALHEMRFPLRNTQYHEMDLLSSIFVPNLHLSIIQGKISKLECNTTHDPRYPTNNTRSS